MTLIGFLAKHYVIACKELRSVLRVLLYVIATYNQTRQSLATTSTRGGVGKNSKKGHKYIIWVDVSWPFDAQDAGSIRSLEIMKLLRTLDYQLVFLYLGAGFKTSHVKDVQVAFTFGEAVNLARSGIDNVPFLWYSRVQSAIIWSAMGKRYFPNSLTVFDTVDLTFRRLDSMASSYGSRLIQRLARSFESLEKGVSRWASATLVVSDVEKSELANPGASKIYVVPTLHSISTNRPNRNDVTGLVFIGNFSHLPNGEGLSWFLEEVWPLLGQSVRDEGLRVIGKDPPTKLASRFSDEVEFCGWVNNAEIEISKSRVSIAPLLSGAGVKGKISQALLLGVPVVTTSIGAEGMGLVSGETALIADDPADFANEINLLFFNRELAERIGSNGQRLGKAQFSIDSVSPEIKLMMNDLGNDHGRN